MSSEMGSAPGSRGPRLEGRRLGRYRLGDKIASGGMGSVYLATTRGLAGVARRFAVKTMHVDLLETPNQVNRFIDEARTTSRIDHPNVCALIDFGEDQGITYLVMEYLHGEPLSALMRNQGRVQVPLWLVCRVIADAARGLHAAHELKDLGGESFGIVHRDVSPQNLFVLYDGPSKVLDFGIARMRDRLAATSAGRIRGKIGYVAPEQIRASSHDHRVDLWSLGVVLHEALSGERLFHRPEPKEAFAAVLEAPLPDAFAGRPEAPESLRTLVDRSLVRDPDHRIATAAEFADTLEQCIVDMGERADHARVAAWMHEHFEEAIREKDAHLLALREGPTTEIELMPEDVETDLTRIDTTLPPVREATTTAAFPSEPPPPPSPPEPPPLLWALGGFLAGVVVSFLLVLILS